LKNLKSPDLNYASLGETYQQFKTIYILIWRKAVLHSFRRYPFPRNPFNRIHQEEGRVVPHRDYGKAQRPLEKTYELVTKELDAGLDSHILVVTSVIEKKKTE
jgi:hypothetical protein